MFALVEVVNNLHTGEKFNCVGLYPTAHLFLCAHQANVLFHGDDKDASARFLAPGSTAGLFTSFTHKAIQVGVCGFKEMILTLNYIKFAPAIRPKISDWSLAPFHADLLRY